MEIDHTAFYIPRFHDLVLMSLRMFSLSGYSSLESLVTQTCSLMEHSIHFMKLAHSIKHFDAGVFSGLTLPY